MNSNQIIGFILAGSSGTILWPLSRKSFPKQFYNLIKGDEFSLLQRTFKRIENLANLSKPIIILMKNLKINYGKIN